MSEINGKEIVGPRKLQRAESERTLWSHRIPEDVPLEHAFEPDYWRRCTEQLKGGDRVECITADRRTLFEIFILESNFQADPPRVDMVFRAIYPPDLKVPKPIVEPARWILKQRSTDGLFLVFDREKDEIIIDGQRREAAMQHIALLEKLQKETASARAA